MKAVMCNQWGPYDQLTIEEIDSPKIKADEVLVDIKAVGLNFFDTLIVEKKYQVQPELPFSPGGEIAGVVREVGAAVAGFGPGDRVMACVGYNGAREQLAIPAIKVTPIPDNLSFEVAAGLSITYGTSLHALRDRAKIRPGETLAVLGASGGVGQSAIEIGKYLGARVIACASSKEKLTTCQQLGADELLNYKQVDLKTELKRLTDGKGVDVVYDPVGGDMSEAALRATGWNGRFLVIGFASGSIAKIPLNLPLLKGNQILGVFWSKHIEREPQKHLTNLSTIINLCANGTILPRVYKIKPLIQIKLALDAIAKRKVQGKVILTV
ncbi:MAG TPA: NADPH:quinone oxidoreductase family protein [Rhizobiales bacterium]|nr:NADPH:quinone oxidoreductase family protein [Hyphomicrobiales bacterium]